MDKDSSEISKLTERIAKDPKSKLFVPLAEEYKKAGDIGKAVSVLTEGLKNNPGYVTARSFLGRLLMESGDLAGAQKELEEVIRAIPDNLLAQRKLGDLYVLLGKSDDALKRYKAALALNPGDKEVSSFVAELEAGRDISGRIPRPKTAASPAPAAAKVAAPATPAKTASAAAAAPSQARPAGGQPPAASKPAGAAPSQQVPASRPAVAPQPAPPAKPAVVPRQAPSGPVAAGASAKETSQRPQPAHGPAPVVPPVEERLEVPEQVPAPRPKTDREPAPLKVLPAAAPPKPLRPQGEAVEEIMELEPLEKLAAEAAAMPEVKRVSKTASLPPQKTVHEEPSIDAFDLSEPAGAAVSFEGEQQPMEWAPPPEPALELAAGTKGEEPEDDINTDTLAELYISQAFYEKAIEIYERMLSERPGTVALEQKLQRLRALAAAAEKGGTAIPASPGAPAVERSAGGSGEYVIPAADFAEEESVTEEGPVPETPALAEATPARAEMVEDAVKEAPAAAATRPRPAEEGSLKAMQEALEVSERQKPTPPATGDQGASHLPQTARVRRKETIDRLETWLKNVMKEKPE